jgi:hypothetical protein
VSKLPAVNAIWIGPELGKMQAACLRSFVRAGHRTVLHCYGAPTDVPNDVEIADAARHLPESQLRRHRETGSFALFSDLLRYKILRAGLGLYVDCDIFCVRPVEDEDYIFGWSGPKTLNNAVLKLPPDCPCLSDLCRIGEPLFMPPWFTFRHRLGLRARQLLGGPMLSIEDLPWGSTGPKALTYFAHKHGIDRYAKDKEVLYPIDNHEIALLFDPERSLDELIAPTTVAIHLYNEYFRRRSFQVIPVPPTSPLGRMLATK